MFYTYNENDLCSFVTAKVVHKYEMNLKFFLTNDNKDKQTNRKLCHAFKRASSFCLSLLSTCPFVEKAKIRNTPPTSTL